jgi:hypothetical protein
VSQRIFELGRWADRLGGKVDDQGTHDCAL